MRGLLVAAVAVIAVICGAYLLLGDGGTTDSTDPESGEVHSESEVSYPDASFEVSDPVYSSDAGDATATVTVTPSSSGTHTWYVGESQYTTTGTDQLALTLAISDEPYMVIHLVSSGTCSAASHQEIVADGAVTKTLTWTDLSGTSRTVTVDLDWSVWSGLRSRSATSMDMATILDSDDPVIPIIATQLAAMWPDGDGDGWAAELLRFIQLALAYQDDRAYTGYWEWYKYPYETIFDGGGDCEDTAMLYVMLAREMGLDAVLIRMSDGNEGHVAAGVALDVGFGDGDTVTVGGRTCGYSGVEIDGVIYWYCETATDSYIPLGVDYAGKLEYYIGYIA